MIRSTCLNYGFDVIGAQSNDVIGAWIDDVIVTPNVGLMKKPDSEADVACNNLKNFQVSFLVYIRIRMFIFAIKCVQYFEIL